MKKKQILIVEDERIVADDIKVILQKLGYAVSGIALSGEEALKKAEEVHPDLVLMDIVLEGEMDGIKATSIMRSRFDIPVVYLTAYADHKTINRAKRTKPFGYIIKPFEDKDLHSTIEMAFYKEKMERKLKEREHWLSTVLKSIGDAVIATDTKGYVTYMNPVAQTLTGWKQQEAVSKPLKDVFNIINGVAGKVAEDPATRLLRESRGSGLANNTVLIAKDGRKTPIDYSCAPIRFKKGEIMGTVLIFQDITKRKKTTDELRKAYVDLKKTQQDLIQSEKLAALGKFSSGIAHEIKNPLAIILGGSEYLEKKLSKTDADIKTTIDMIKESIFSANIIVEGLLKLARPPELKTERIKPNDLINDTLSLLKYRTSLINIKIETHFAKEKLHIVADKNQIQQVFFTLFMNAIEAMPTGGMIIVKTYKMALSEFSLDKHLCVIEIKDTGKGIPKENLQRLFEPFFTTKRKKKGTGLGLSMAKLIVNNHKGTLEINSKLEKGTTAKIMLPLA